MSMNREHEQELMRPYQFSVDVGHSKSGSDHVMIIKSLKVRSDNPVELVQTLQLMLDRINTSLNGGGSND